ncbi:MAG: WD40 repeat domain-containing protein [Pseudomonadota bacterium]
MPTIAPYDFDCHVEWAGFINDDPVFALADGTVHFPLGSQKTVSAHDGLLTATLSPDAKSLVTGGEDGRICRVSEGAAETIAEKPGKWIDMVACGPGNAVAYGAGRTVWTLVDDKERCFEHERAVEGVTFAPKGLRIACARYNGVTLHWVSQRAKPVDLHWDGAHTGVTYSPNGRYVVTTMAENALHGWRLDDHKLGDGKHMRMSGYPAKPKSLSWSPKGKWLASSGAQAAVCWPFSGKDGPMGQTPLQLGQRSDSMVTQVAFHPSQEVLAIGYADGMVAAARVSDSGEALLRRSGKGPISSLHWDKGGTRLVFGSEEGEAGLISTSD